MKCVEGDDSSFNSNPKDVIAEVNDSVETNREVTSAIWSVPLFVSQLSLRTEGEERLTPALGFDKLHISPRSNSSPSNSNNKQQHQQSH